jgi:hypothetical protein
MYLQKFVMFNLPNYSLSLFSHSHLASSTKKCGWQVKYTRVSLRDGSKVLIQVAKKCQILCQTVRGGVFNMFF